MQPTIPFTQRPTCTIQEACAASGLKAATNTRLISWRRLSRCLPRAALWTLLLDFDRRPGGRRGPR